MRPASLSSNTHWGDSGVVPGEPCALADRRRPFSRKSRFGHPKFGETALFGHRVLLRPSSDFMPND